MKNYFSKMKPRGASLPGKPFSQIAEHSIPCYQFNAAIVRQPASSVVDGLRAVDRGAPDYHKVVAEHDAYVKTLKSVGMDVTVLPPLEAFPDSVFVEDPALVFTEGAILLRPGAASRLKETEEIAPALMAIFDTVLELPSPGFVDGGDILVTPEAVMIGLSSRTDRKGAKGLVDQLATLGYRGEIVNPPKGVLHFKTACSLLDEESVLVTRLMAESGLFDHFRKMVLPEDETPAANAVRINASVLVSEKYKKTADMLDRNGYKVIPVKTEEIEKIDAGLSCMSLRWFKR